MSQRSEKYNLTEGNILKKLLLVSLPVMGSQLMQMSYNLADMFWLGRVGSDAVAASGTAGMFMWLSMAFLMIGRMGAEIGASQSLGRGDPETAKKYAQNAVLLALINGVGFALILILFNRPLVGFFNIQDPAVARQAESYLFIVALAIPVNFLSGALIGAFNAYGNTRTPFIVNTIGLVLNMILDPLMIFGLNMGIEGAALATILAQFISFLLILLATKRDKNRPFEKFALFCKPSGAFIRQILKWTTPICLENMLFTLMSMITSRFVAGFGVDAMAVARVGSQIESLTWLIGGGYGAALTAFMGQNYGARKWARIHKGFSVSVYVMLLWGAIVMAIIFFGGGLLYSVFLPNELEIIAMGVIYLRIISICQIPQCFEAIAGSTFKGIGRTLPPAVVSISSNVLRVLLAYLLSRTALGLHGIWWAIALTATLRGLWGFAWYLLAARKLPKEDLPAEAVAAVLP